MEVKIYDHVFDGIHESTRDILDFMSQTDFKDKEVIDVGCGSGILTVRAAELGAKHITALDFDNRATENTRQNLELNGITNADVYWTDFMETDLHADIIIANLPRETGAFCMPKMKQSLNKGGTIITSWYNALSTDELLDGWDTVSHFIGEDYDAYILRRKNEQYRILESGGHSCSPYFFTSNSRGVDSGAIDNRGRLEIPPDVGLFKCSVFSADFYPCRASGGRTR